jgi:hypothetical protein
MMKKTFKAKLQKSPNKAGWIYVVWPESAKFFGTRLSKGESQDRGASVSCFVYGYGWWEAYVAGEGGGREGCGRRGDGKVGRTDIVG